MSNGAFLATSNLDSEFYKWAYPRQNQFNRVELIDDAGDESFELAEMRRHRTMIWELAADFCRSGEYDPWHSSYYVGSTQKNFDYDTPFDPSGYGPPSGDPRHPADPPATVISDLQSNTVELGSAPGLNALLDTDDLHNFWTPLDGLLSDFGGSRGGYELFTDFFVDIVDGFRGAYINGPVREINKCPTKEDYTYVGHVHEELHGLQPGWTWNEYIGTQKHESAGQRSVNYVRSSAETSYFNYRGDASNDSHPLPGDDRLAAADDEADFGIITKELVGPISAATDEALVDTAPEVSGGSYDPSSYNFLSLSESKYGYGAPGAAGVTWQKEKLTNGTIWSQTKVGPSVTVTESTNESKIFSETTVGKTYKKEEITDGKIYEQTGKPFVDIWTESHYWGRLHEHFWGGKFETALDGELALQLAAKLELVVGLVTEIFIGGKLEVNIGGKIETSLAATLDLGVDKHFEVKGKKIKAALSVDDVSAKTTTLSNQINGVATGVLFLASKFSA